MRVPIFIAHLSPCSEFHVCVSSFCCDCFIWSFQETVSRSHPIFSWRPGYNFFIAISLGTWIQETMIFLPFVHRISRVDFVLPVGSQESLLRVEMSGLVLRCSEFYNYKSILPNFLLIGTFHWHNILFAAISSYDIPILLKICL